MKNYEWLNNVPISKRYKVAKYKFACIEPTASMNEDEVNRAIKNLKRREPTALFKKIKVK